MVSLASGSDDTVKGQFILPFTTPLFPHIDTKLPVSPSTHQNLLHYLDAFKFPYIGVVCIKPASSTYSSNATPSPNSLQTAPNSKKESAYAHSAHLRSGQCSSKDATDGMHPEGHMSNGLLGTQDLTFSLPNQDGGRNAPITALDIPAMHPANLSAADKNHPFTSLPTLDFFGNSNKHNPNSNSLNGVEALYSVGCWCKVAHLSTSLSETKNGQVRGFIHVEALSRFRIVSYTQLHPYKLADILLIPDNSNKSDSPESVKLYQKIAEITAEYIKQKYSLSFSARSFDSFKSVSLVSYVTDFAAFVMVEITAEEKQQVLEMFDVPERQKFVLSLLERIVEAEQLIEKVDSNMKNQIKRDMREALIRKQISEWQKELKNVKREKSSALKKSNGIEDSDDAWLEEESEEDDMLRLQRMLKDANLSEEALKVAKRELNRLHLMQSHHAEYMVTRNYLETLASVPWNKHTDDEIDMHKASKILEEDHSGIDTVKTRVLEFLAVRKLRKDMKGPILCLLGPPGIGKTSIGKSIARALGRKFRRLSLGGLRDEAELRGHRRTYIGSMPGSIIHALISCGVKNPVILLDEVDKLAYSNPIYNPSAALLEILDPEQNSEFKDHYLGVPFDLSKVLFICTGNTLSTVPTALIDRLEVLHLSGYTTIEKLLIARRHLLRKQLFFHGLYAPISSRVEGAPEEYPLVHVTDDALMKLILNYTAESGVRELERCIGTLCRWAALRIEDPNLSLDGIRKPSGAASASKMGTHAPSKMFIHHPDGRKTLHIDKWLISEIMGAELFDQSIGERLVTPGIAIGLAVSTVGGDILFIEATKVKGCGNLLVTGKLGRVMRESVRTALSLLQAMSLVHSSSPPSPDKHPLGATPNPSDHASELHVALPYTQCHSSPLPSFSSADTLNSFYNQNAVEPRTSKATLVQLDPSKDISKNPLNIRLPEALDFGIHVHIPGGAVAKDGPSAGVAITVALASLLLSQIVRSDIAFTGEVTLRGTILSVGGIKEKLLAANRAGLTKVVIPRANASHLTEVPQEVLSQLAVYCIRTINEALCLAFKSDISDISPINESKLTSAKASHSIHTNNEEISYDSDSATSHFITKWPLLMSAL